MDELEWRRIDDAVTAEQREQAVDELIELAQAVDGIVRAQAAADSAYFAATCGRHLSSAEASSVQQTLVDAYRRQYLVSGFRHPHFAATLADLTSEAQLERIHDALSYLMPAPMLRVA